MLPPEINTGGAPASDPKFNPADLVPPKAGSDQEDAQKEEKLVTKRWREYDDARTFDEGFRKQVAIDRRYAAGTSDLSWAVTTNLIGAYIDILVALLYARNPDVSVSKAPQVDEDGTIPYEVFARTLQIVISRLWKQGKLKQAARKGVRSVLSNSEGWFKCTMVSERTPQPEVERALNDAQETIARLRAQQELIDDPNSGGDPATEDAEMEEKTLLVAELQAKLEVAVTKMFVIDFVPTENMQVSTDVTSIADYLDADWCANELYLGMDDALARFPDLTPEDLTKAKIYYQRQAKDTAVSDQQQVVPNGGINAESANAYTTSTPTKDGRKFVRVIEQWDRTDKHIRTMIEGVKKWAKAPYTPPYPTSRFQPYFYFAFYEVDGARHAQSLSWRLYKLQDEYSTARSNFRLTRERSIPGVLFNAAQLDPTQAKKLEAAKHQEYTAIVPADPDAPMANLFAPKPVAQIDMRVFDVTYILNDMERISGVQEALSAAAAAPGNPITATQAQIQQSGTNARTGSDRDALEVMLSDMAKYTAEQSLQCLSIEDVQKIAGKTAFWPHGMAIEDLFTLVEVEIEAGTTGKPRQGTDQQAWATLLPQLQQMIGQIEQALATGNTALADSLTALVKESMLRLGDESDVSRFIPKTPPPGSPGAGAPPPPVQPTISISLKGDISPEVAQSLVAPTLALDAPPPPAPAPGAQPAPGQSLSPSPGVPSGPQAPGAGPTLQ